MKYSKQREAIVNYLRSTHSHPSADDIYMEVRKTHPNISLGTIYRNLAQLTQNGVIIKLETGSGKDHYDGFTHKHYHFVCSCCDRVFDINIPEVQNIDKYAEQASGFKVENHTIMFYGQCNDCMNNQKAG